MIPESTPLLLALAAVVGMALVLPVLAPLVPIVAGLVGLWFVLGIG